MTQRKPSTSKLVGKSRPVLSRSIPRAAAVTPTRDFTQYFQDADLTAALPTCNPSEACINSYQGTIGAPPAYPNVPGSIYSDVLPGPTPPLSVTLVLSPADNSVYHITGLTLGLGFVVNGYNMPLPTIDWVDVLAFQILDPAGQVLYDSGGCALTSYYDQTLQQYTITDCYDFSQLDVPGAKILTLTRDVTILSTDVQQYEAFIWSVAVHTTCEPVPVVQQCQGGSIWASDQYNKDPRLKIVDVGCALTSLSMALNANPLVTFAGGLTSIRPSDMNIFARQGNWYSGLDVNFDVFVRLVTEPGKGWKFIDMGGQQSLQSLVDPICSGHPVIVGVKLKVDNSGQYRPGHYVLVIGIDPTDPSTFLIADPACGSKTTLKDYGNVFVARGYLDDPPNDVSGLDIAVTNCYVLVTSPAGQRTGIDPASGTDFNEIPQSGHYIGGLVNDTTGVWLPDTSSTVQLFQPNGGAYRVQLTSLLPQPSVISLFAFSADGTVNHIIRFPWLLLLDISCRLTPNTPRHPARRWSSSRTLRQP